MYLIFIQSKGINKQTKEIYLNALFAKITNTVYLNIDTLASAFKHPEHSSHTDQYDEISRIIKPSNKAIIDLAVANIQAGKTVIIDGNFDTSLINEHLNSASITKEQVKILSLIISDVTNEPAVENLIEINVIDATNTLHQKVNAVITKLPDIASPSKAQLKPFLAMSAGLAGAGKTTSCAEIAKRTPDCVLLPKDIIGLTFLESVGLDMQSPYYSEHIKNQTYQALFALAEENITLGNSAVIDGWFGDKLKEPWFKEHLGATSYTTKLIYFHCTAETQLARIKERNARRDDAKLADFAGNRRLDLQAHLRDFAQLTLKNILFVDTEQDLEQNTPQVVSNLGLQPLSSLDILAGEAPHPQSYNLTPHEGMGDLQEFKKYLARVENWAQFNSNRLFKPESAVRPLTLSKDDMDLNLSSSSRHPPQNH